MPEGPEVAREADRIRAALGGERIENVRFAFPALQRRAGRFSNARVESVRARGKAMLIEFDNELTIYSHNQLYGRWYVRKAGSLPPTNRQLRLVVEGPSKWALLYSASEIDVLDAKGVANHPYLAKLGPDALDSELDAESLRARLAAKPFARRQLGALLLDQGFVAGIGNYLRSEICFEARVHPTWRPTDLDSDRRRRLARAILRVSRRAYRSRGVTLPAERAKALREQGVSWRRARHWVFVRSGLPCRVCRTRIERFDLSSRRIYLCSGCQPKPGGGSPQSTLPQPG
jgi:endonuclease-8